MSEFLNMGGYAAFVWPSYALVAITLVLNWYLPKIRHRNLLKQLKRRSDRDG